MKLLLALATSIAIASCQRDPWAKLTKPILRANLDDLEAGLEQYLPTAASTITEWTNGYIPTECRDIARNEKRSPADFRVFNVKYSDCGDPWTFCYHKNSEITIQSMASQFGKLPIQMRDFVRHVICMPDTGGHAYMSGANIVFFRPVNNMVGVFTHETGHSLDFNNAYGSQLSNSDNWWNKYAQDSNVPDGYAQSNMVEDVAQAHTIAVFNEHYPDKFASKEPNWQKIFNQYATVITVARENGRGGKSVIGPSQGQTCSKRFASSTPVPKTATVKARSLGAIPDVSLKFAEPFDFEPVQLSTKGNCSMHW